MKQNVLDEWDCRLIRLFKRAESTNPDEVLKVWRERCNLPEGCGHLNDVNRHLIVLAHKLNLFQERFRFEQFIFSLQPEENWKYVTNVSALKKDTTDFNLILLSRLESLFAFAESNRLPGYRIWIDTQP